MAIDIKEEIANYLLNNCFLIGNVDSTREKYYDVGVKSPSIAP